MRRNCNLELQLLPSSASFSSSTSPDSTSHFYRPEMPSFLRSPKEEQDEQQQQQQQLTIFYNGRVCVCDVTELQARSILMMANREMEERMKSPKGVIEPASPNIQYHHQQLYSPTGLSMKRSLQRFLQKRKHRVQETSPYHH